MNRQVVTSTLSRRGVALDCCRATSTLLNTSRPFSTTTTRCAAEDDKPSANKPSDAAAAPRAPGPVSPSRQKSEAAVGKLTQLRGSFTSLTDDNSFQKAPPAGARDLRRFAAPINRDGRSGTVSPLGGGGGAGGGGPSGAPKVINVRSLKGTLGRGRFAPGGGVPGAVAPGAALRPRFGAGAGGPGAGDRRSAGPSGPPGRPRFGSAPGAPGGGPRTAGARRPGFIKRPKSARGGGEKKPRRGEDEDERPATEEEIAFINTLEQGKVSEYVPRLTPDTLLGYGPPMATDAALGKVETALRTMRILGGGLPFNTESGVTSDPTAVKHRYLHEKKPVFFSSVEEKEWLEESLDKFALSSGPKDKTKRAILETSVLGKYEAPKFVESITDTVAMVEKYQGSTFSYASSDANKFKAKLNQLLAAGQPRAAAPSQKKA